jgi:C-terminal processing protease CtpA/Prc
MTAQPIVEINHVASGSPAERAGLKPGTRIVEIEDSVESKMLKVKQPYDLARAFWDRRFDGNVRLRVEESGIKRDIELALGYCTVPPSDVEIIRDKIGLWITSVPASRVNHLSTNYLGGLLVLDVITGSHGAKAGLKPGDIILGLHGYSMVEPANLTYFMSSTQPIEASRGYPSIVPNDTSLKCLFMRDGAFAPETKLFVPRLESLGRSSNATVNTRK